MFLKKSLIAFFATILSLMLSACGGGDTIVLAGTTDETSTPTEVKVGQVALVQLKSGYLARPGQTVLISTFKVKCEGVMSDGYCPWPHTEVGNIVLQSSVELTDAVFTMGDGTQIQGEFVAEGGGKYRFKKYQNASYYFWQEDIFTVTVTVSPYAKEGEHTLVLLEVGTLDPDKKIEVKAEMATLTVYESATLAPMSITASDAFQGLVYQDGERPFVEYQVTVECAHQGCSLLLDLGWVRNLHPGSPVYICSNSNQCWVEHYASMEEGEEDGSASVRLNWYLYQNGRETYTVRLYPSDQFISNGGNFALFIDEEDTQGWIAGESVKPKFGTFETPEKGCTVVTPGNCKG